MKRKHDAAASSPDKLARALAIMSLLLTAVTVYLQYFHVKHRLTVSLTHIDVRGYGPDGVIQGPLLFTADCHFSNYGNRPETIVAAGFTFCGNRYPHGWSFASDVSLNNTNSDLHRHDSDIRDVALRPFEGLSTEHQETLTLEDVLERDSVASRNLQRGAIDSVAVAFYVETTDERGAVQALRAVRLGVLRFAHSNVPKATYRYTSGELQYGSFGGLENGLRGEGDIVWVPLRR